ncbi:UDP-galactopyranose mutase [Qiania dongpingensis]|uniref:UDP-galactopyranose mutase n=1 Tax=Qiania dongpingensis TaxID=2763669 RepID=A0A7G9G7V0_9FIRM|nr:UDP-galactopyranose mutase [Qiania dongpingensis]QNM06882.1 UDP-galactopyranose mutase [Qiania dongpingensis]
MKKFDYVIVGGGLFGGVMAWYARKNGKTCLIVEKRKQLGGNIYCEDIEGIPVHRYGAHIFHTSDKNVWQFVNGLVEFNRYTNCPVANYHGEMYNMPFNMNTFSKMWGISTPEEARAKIEEQRAGIFGQPANLEEQAISLVGTDIYEKLIKGYTEKQWGRACKELPSFIIKRLPVRYTYDNNYFNDRYQGIPIGGYNGITEKLFEGCEVMLETDYLADKKTFDAMGDRIIYTGTIDAYFNYRYGKLEYRSLRFEDDIFDVDNYQGVAVVNHTAREVPYTRTIEHKHFNCTVPYSEIPKTVVTREYSVAWEEGMEPYYPVNDEKNQELYQKYAELGAGEKNVMFGGRLAEYKYYDMDKVIESAMKKAEAEFGSLA